MIEPKTRTVTLTLTQSCNLACSYCYEHHKSAKVMDLTTAKHIIDYELAHCNDVDGLEFDLFGGEPFLEFELLKEITEYICHKKKDVPCLIFTTTNGTLVHGYIQEWLKQHAGCFVCGLSLDGTREMHNRNRCNSYDDIDLDFFRTQYPDQEVKMTISGETLPDLSAGVIDLHQKGFTVSCNLAYDIDWSDPVHQTTLDRELHILIDYYLDNPKLEPCSMLGMDFSSILQEESGAYRYCGAGQFMRSYDVDGSYYPCQFFMPLSLGQDRSAAAQQITFPDDIIPLSNLDDKCRSCIIRNACPNCFGANYAATGNIYHRDNNLCQLTKIMLKARSFFRAQQWVRGQIPDSQDTQILLRTILLIQEDLQL